MSNELKVNAKTDNLEFKRKHNKLVDVVKGNCPKSEIPGFQGTTVIARNALTNVNGWELTSFKAIDGTYAGYTIKTITENDDTATILTEERAKVYLKAMTGSEFLPKYDYNLPQNSYLIFSDGTIWKPQFDETNGLRLFKMFEMPASGTKLYKHYISFTGLATTDSGDPVLKQCNLDIIIVSNQQEFYFNSSMTTYEVAEALSMLFVSKTNFIYASYSYNDNIYDATYGRGNSIDLLQMPLGIFVKNNVYSYQNISFECSNCSYTQMKEKVVEL